MDLAINITWSTEDQKPFCNIKSLSRTKEPCTGTDLTSEEIRESIGILQSVIRGLYVQGKKTFEKENTYYSNVTDEIKKLTEGN